ncbi:hypothetical protein GIW21_18460 [Pseudomonas syringae]|nr:hypothetical protein [Pseudomonas syringae]
MSSPHRSLDLAKVAAFVPWNIERPSDLAYLLGGDLYKLILRHVVESSI